MTPRIDAAVTLLWLLFAALGLGVAIAAAANRLHPRSEEPGRDCSCGPCQVVYAGSDE